MVVLLSGNAGLWDDQKNTEANNNTKDNTRNVDLSKKLNTIEASTPSVDAADSGPGRIVVQQGEEKLSGSTD